jgi:hypothetical protein
VFALLIEQELRQTNPERPGVAVSGEFNEKRTLRSGPVEFDRWKAENPICRTVTDLPPSSHVSGLKPSWLAFLIETSQYAITVPNTEN